MRQKRLGARWSIPSACLVATLFSLACGSDTLGDRDDSSGAPNPTSGAVSSGQKPSAPIDLEYAAPTSIEAGTPFELDLQFRTRAAGEALTVEVSAMPGLVILGSHAARFAPAEANRDYATRIRAIADASGTFYLGIVAQLATREKSDARAFSIAIRVGPSEPSARRAPMAQTVGEPIESMPAQESIGETRATPKRD